MIFQDRWFSPEQVSDPGVRAVLCSAAFEAGKTLRAGDLLASVIRHGPESVQAILTQALRPGASLIQVLNTLEASGEPRRQTSDPRGRESFTPQALKALEEFDSALRAGRGALDGFASELLTYYVLTNLEERMHQLLSFIDVPRAAALCRRCLSQALGPRMPQPDSPPRVGESDQPAGGSDEPFHLPPELAPSEDLTHRARTGVVPADYPFDQDPKYERLFDAMTRILHRRRANHVFLVGERGVGKSTVVAELARRAASGQIPFLFHRRFVSVDCRFIPPDESRQRLAAILAYVAAFPGVLLCLDGLTSLLRAEGGRSNKAVLLASLVQAAFQIIALVTPRDLEESFADDPDFSEFFASVEVEEPDPDVALKILYHFARGLEQQYQVSIDQEAIRQAVVLSSNYILNDHLPAKALNILHRLCEDINYERCQRSSPRRQLTSDDVFRQTAQISGVPEETLRGIADRSDYEQSLGEVVLGQDHAVREVATELGLIKAGLTDPNKPASVMLFLGPTGTGKTEMAKALARFYSTSKRLKTYTLGNCVEPHSVATIIGVPPGYVGHDQGGRLVNELNVDPYCVFLLDEADKAHPDVLQPFLNLFDEGWVCDQRGARAYASKSIFILTTNVGQRMITELFEQGKSLEEISARMKDALSEIRHSKSNRPVFTPEFLARIKRIIVFKPLDSKAMDGICRKLVAEMQQAWSAKRGKKLEVAQPLIRHIADQAHNLNQKSKGREGGRIVRKLIADLIEAEIQRQSTQRPLEYRQGQVIRVGLLSNAEAATASIALQFLDGNHQADPASKS